MGILDLFGGEERITKLRVRITDLEVDMAGLKQRIDTLQMEISQAKKKKTFVSKTEEEEKPESEEGKILPEPTRQSFYNR